MQERATGLIDISLALRLVVGGEVVLGVLPEPLGHLGEFLAQAVDGLLVHVRLGDEFGETHWPAISVLLPLFFGGSSSRVKAGREQKRGDKELNVQVGKRDIPNNLARCSAP